MGTLKRRCATLAVLGLWLITLVSPAIRVQAAEDQESPVPTVLPANTNLLDLARAVPYPADFGEVIPTSGWLDGQFITLDEEATRIADANGGVTADHIREIRRKLVAAGWLQRYEGRIAVPDADDPSLFTIQVASFAVQYGLVADAQAAFATLPGEDAGVGFPRISDESMLTMFGGVAADTGSDYEAAQLFFRTGPIIGSIVYADLRGEPPDLSLLATIAQQVAARTVLVTNRQTVPLSAMVMRLDPSSVSGQLVQHDEYDVRAGILTPLYAEDDASTQDRVRRFTGPTDAFTSITTSDETTAAPSLAETPGTTSAPDEHREPPGLSMTSALFAFPDERKASAWLLTQRERVVEESPSEFTEVPDAPGVGDTSVTFATQEGVGGDEHALNGFRIYARVGAIVALLEMQSQSGVSLAQVTKLMHQQVEHIAAERATTQLANLSSTATGEPTGIPDTSPVAEPPLAAPEELIVPPEDAVTPSPVAQPAPADGDEVSPPADEVTGVPTAAPFPAVVEEATPPRVEELTPAPVVVATSGPSAEPTMAAGAEPTPPDVGEAKSVPSEAPTPVPAEEPTPVSAAGPTPAPVEEPTATPASERVTQEDDGNEDDRTNQTRDNDGRRRDREKGRNKD